MVMSDTLTSSGTNETRLVTVADLRYELERERQLTLAHFARIDQRFLDLITSVDTRFRDLTASADARFEQVDQRFEQVGKRFEQVDQRFDLVDKRFDQVDQRFEQVDKRFDQIDKRFDALDLRLRSSKTLAVMSLTAAASIASVVITLLK